MHTIAPLSLFDENKAREFLEAQRWPAQIICPHCGGGSKVYKLRPRASSLKGTHVRPGLRKCGKCRKEFTVSVGTIFHNSRIPLHKWLYAYHLLCTAEETVNAYRLHRALGITYKSACFMLHRLRFAWVRVRRKTAEENFPELPMGHQSGPRRSKLPPPISELLQVKPPRRRKRR